MLHKLELDMVIGLLADSNSVYGTIFLSACANRRTRNNFVKHLNVSYFSKLLVYRTFDVMFASIFTAYHVWTIYSVALRFVLALYKCDNVM